MEARAVTAAEVRYYHGLEQMNKPEPTILEPDEVAVVYTKDKGYKFLIPDTLDDDEVPDEAYDRPFQHRAL